MILQRLAEHYDRIEKELPPPGFSLQKISFCVVLNADGSLNSFQSLQEKVGTRLVARPMIVPGQGKPSGSGLNPCLLWDNASYMLGWSADPDPDKSARAAMAFEAFREKHFELESRIENPAFTSVCSFLGIWSPEQALDHAEVLKDIASNFGVFRVAGEMQYVHEQISAPAETEEQAAVAEAGVRRGMCLVSGTLEEIARLHEPKIKGVADAQPGGALLVSFNASAYESYGKPQSYNAPVSAMAAFKYANALNYLLDRRDRRVSLGDSTVVYWADHDAGLLEDGLNELFGGAFSDEGPVVQEDQERLREAELLLKQLRDGTGATAIGASGQSTRFFLLGLSPNASRISVRLWVEADAAELQKLLGQHLRDIELDGSRNDRLLTLRLMVASTGRWDGKKARFNTDNVSPQLAGDLTRSVLTGAAYPQSLLATMLRRMHSDGEVAYARAAAIKACLVRNSRLRGNPLEVSVKLDPAETNAGYNCGRLFALLEKAQTDSADGELNTTIKDRYFSSASTTPALVFPRLFRLAQHHLAKLETGHKISYDRRFAEVMGLLDIFPRQLALEDQGRFVIGYFHQRQDLYTSKKDKEEGATA